MSEKSCGCGEFWREGACSVCMYSNKPCECHAVERADFLEGRLDQEKTWKEWAQEETRNVTSMLESARVQLTIARKEAAENLARALRAEAHAFAAEDAAQLLAKQLEQKS